MGDYEDLAAEIDAFHIGNRTRSVAMLAWFLARVWRVDPEEVDDAICDGGGDKGIDGIHVDEDAKDIVVLQGKHRSNAAVTQGDADLKSFMGVQAYFSGPEGVDALLESAPNAELIRLVNRVELREKLESGNYTVTYVFVTNGERDAAAVDYLAAVEQVGIPLELWDRPDLAAVARRTQVPGLLSEKHTLPTPGGVVAKTLASGAEMALAFVPASEIVQLPGISNLTLFDLNVRLGLGKTRINRELAATVRDSNEHDAFPAYHNGITVLTGNLDIADDRTSFTLDGMSVVNGCQSVLALYNNRSSLTPALDLTVKVIEVPTGSPLIDRITYRSNNQNPVNMRDQRANDAAQRELQEQMSNAFGSSLFYAIRNGEDTGGAARVLDNRVAAQLLTAVYREQPWAAVRKVKLFDDEYYEVFTKYVTAQRLYLLDLMEQEVSGRRGELRPELDAAFASVKFTLVFLVGALLRRSALGEELLEDPAGWLPDNEDEVRKRIGEFAAEAIRTLNDFVKARENDTAFDFKVAFKSRTGVLAVAAEAMHIADVVQSRVGGFDFDIDRA